MEKNIASNMSASPKVTVLMPVYNGERFLREAVESILNQTFGDFEFLIIDDGSLDRSAEIIRGYDDPRIRLIRNETNLGIVASLNRGIDQAQGEYIARMDCDDISMPARLEKQVAFMEKHPGVGVCGTWARVIDDRGQVVSLRRSPQGKAAHRLCWRPTPFIHPTCMLRSALLKEYRYLPGFPHAEDYELWLRLCRRTLFANIGEYLLHYRAHDANIGRSRRTEQLAGAYAAFTAFVGTADIDFPGFLALVPVAANVNPFRRAVYWLKAAKKTGVRWDEFFLDNIIYLKLWLTRYNEQAAE
jgi:glycosyltransferase involved in cell wall biosynthesis